MVHATCIVIVLLLMYKILQYSVLFMYCFVNLDHLTWFPKDNK